MQSNKEIESFDVTYTWFDKDDVFEGGGIYPGDVVMLKGDGHVRPSLLPQVRVNRRRPVEVGEQGDRVRKIFQFLNRKSWSVLPNCKH